MALALESDILQMVALALLKLRESTSICSSKEKHLFHSHQKDQKFLWCTTTVVVVMVLASRLQYKRVDCYTFIFI